MHEMLKEKSGERLNNHLWYKINNACKFVRESSAMEFKIKQTASDDSLPFS
jgi:hypothetical protein